MLFLKSGHFYIVKPVIKPIRYISFILVLVGCTSQKYSYSTIQSVSYQYEVDENQPKIKLTGFFTSELLEQAKNLTCILETFQGKESFEGSLLPGGHVFVIFETKKFENFIQNHSEILIHLDKFHGSLKTASKENKDHLIFKYLPTTIIYDL